MKSINSRQTGRGAILCLDETAQQHHYVSIIVSIFLDTEVPGSGMSSFRKNSGATCRKSGKAGKITLGIKAGKIVVSTSRSK